MKVVFPCKGAIVLNKEDIDILSSFYNSTLVTSKIFDIYNSSEYMMQIGNFSYLPPKTTLILDESKLLTIPKLRSILNIPSSTKYSQTQDKKSEYNEIDEDTILSHPFFKTLKPL